MRYLFISKKPALLWGEYVVVADLHLGIEGRYMLKSDYTLSWTIVDEINKIMDDVGKEKIIILGDVKDKIVTTPRIVEEFLSHLSAKEIVITKGNHDGNLTLPRKGKIVDVLIEKNATFFHGHKLILPQTSLSFMGHVHPEYRKRKVWMTNERGNKKLIVVPAFNPIVGRELTSKPFSPIFRNNIFKWLSSLIYSLEGESLGKLELLVGRE